MNARRLTTRELAEGQGQVGPHIYAEECPIVLQCTEAEADLIYDTIGRLTSESTEGMEIIEALGRLVR